MIDNYQAPEPNRFWSVSIVLLVFFASVGYAMYEQGFNDARAEFSRPIKYRCHEGTVYRSTQGYWEKTGQQCKTLEEIK